MCCGFNFSRARLLFPSLVQACSQYHAVFHLFHGGQCNLRGSRRPATTMAAYIRPAQARRAPVDVGACKLDELGVWALGLKWAFFNSLLIRKRLGCSLSTQTEALKKMVGKLRTRNKLRLRIHNAAAAALGVLNTHLSFRPSLVVIHTAQFKGEHKSILYFL